MTVSKLIFTPHFPLSSFAGGGDPQEVHHYGCRILVGRYTSRGFMYSGSLKMDSVEVRFCGQGGYFSPRDPRYSIAFRNNFDGSSESYIKRCSIHHGYNTAIGIHTSNGVEVSGNVIWRTTDSSVKVGGSGNVIRNNLAMLTTTVQPNRQGISYHGYLLCTYFMLCDIQTSRCSCCGLSCHV